MVSQLTTAGSDEFFIDDVVPMTILAVVLVCGKMLAAIVVAASIQLAFSTKYALTAYETVTMELIDMLKNQGLSSESKSSLFFYNVILRFTFPTCNVVVFRRLKLLLSFKCAFFNAYVRSKFILDITDTDEENIMRNLKL